MREYIDYYDGFRGIGAVHKGFDEANDTLRRIQLSESETVRSVEGELQDREHSNYPELRCVGGCDLDKNANAIYTHRFGKDDGRNHVSGDITELETTSIPDHDIFCAGFPCQAVSIAGEGKGFEDPRGELFFEIIRIARDKEPRMLLLENVDNLLFHDSGLTFGVILRELGRIGYNCRWQIINSKFHGVPQQRARVFITGYFRAKPSTREVFPIRPSLGVIREEDGYPLPTLNATDHKGPGKKRPTILIPDNKPGEHVKQLMELSNSPHRPMSGRIYDPRGVAVAQKALAGGWGVKTGLYATPLSIMSDSRQLSVREDMSHTVMAQESKRTLIKFAWNWDGEWGIRRLTPREGERLQGFPDDWTSEGLFEEGDRVWSGELRVTPTTRIDKVTGEPYVLQVHLPIKKSAEKDGVYPIPDGPRYKALGNSMTVPVIRKLGVNIVKTFEALF